MIPELGKLETVPVTQIWSHEEYEFTPWLVENLDLLSEALDMDLVSPLREVVLRDAGRVDILAKVVSDDNTEETVAIENQLGPANSDHFARLIGYAASQDARILVWVASEFSPYHRRNLEWLNGNSGIEIYGVQVKAWRIGDAVAADLDVVVSPNLQARRTAGSISNTNTAYAQVYRPVVAQLRRAGLPPVGRGGWRGKWRAFQTGHAPHFYSLGLEDVGEAWAYFEARGEDAQAVYDGLREHRAEIDEELKESAVEWHDRQRWITLKTKASLDDPEEKHEETREWMASNLLKLRHVIQPRLNQIVAELQASETDDAAPLQNDTETSP